MKGIGSLAGPVDLLAKLKHDLARIAQDPGDSYAAFDFFVTAEHMIDWLLPGYENSAAQAALRKSNLLLGVVSHIANGSKHFVTQEEPIEDRRPCVSVSRECIVSPRVDTGRDQGRAQ